MRDSGFTCGGLQVVRTAARSTQIPKDALRPLGLLFGGLRAALGKESANPWHQEYLKLPKPTFL